MLDHGCKAAVWSSRICHSSANGRADKLRAEIARLVEWINGDRDALTCLQSVYNDPKASEANRIKAAASGVRFERPKLTVSVQVGPAVLGERLDRAKAVKTVNPPLIEHEPA
jgi:hypothetical protein